MFHILYEYTPRTINIYTIATSDIFNISSFYHYCYTENPTGMSVPVSKVIIVFPRTFLTSSIDYTT